MHRLGARVAWARHLSLSAVGRPVGRALNHNGQALRCSEVASACARHGERRRATGIMILTFKLRLGYQVAAEPDPEFAEPEPQARADRSVLYRDSALAENYRRPAPQAALPGTRATRSVAATGALPVLSDLLLAYTLPKAGHWGEPKLPWHGRDSEAPSPSALRASTLRDHGPPSYSKKVQRPSPFATAPLQRAGAAQCPSVYAKKPQRKLAGLARIKVSRSFKFRSFVFFR